MTYKHTKEDIDFICDPKNTSKDIREKYGCGYATVSRWRKLYNANVPTGSKKGVEKPSRKNGIIKPCKVCHGDMYVPAKSTQQYCSRICLYSCPEYRERLKTVDRSYMQSEEYKKTLRKESTPEFIRYRNRVHKLSDKVYNENIDLINPNRYPRTLAGVEGGWQLDHIIEVKFGFENGIPPEVLSEPKNLRMLPWKDNLSRNKK